MHCHSLYGDTMHQINILVILYTLNYICPQGLNAKPTERHGERGRAAVGRQDTARGKGIGRGRGRIQGSHHSHRSGVTMLVLQ